MKKRILSLFTTKKTKLELVFKDRVPLSNNEFYDTYYLSKGIPFSVVDGIKKTLETELDADLSRLSNSDDFSQNLSFFWDFDSLADVAIVEAFERLFTITISDLEAREMCTIDEIVYSIAGKLNQKQS